MNFIRLNHANVSLQGKLILKNISWQWLPNQHWWIKGDNGAGKSTFLKLVVGQYWPDHQVHSSTVPRTYCFNDKGIEQQSLANVLNHIALVTTQTQSQLTQHGMSWSAEDVIWSGFLGTHTFGSYNRHSQSSDILKVHQSIFSTICEQLLLSNDLLTQHFLTLSNGQQARCLVARAMVLQPTCLVLDEIFNGIDDANKALIIRYIKQIIESRSMSIMIASHQLPQGFEDIINHQLTLKNGCIYEQKAIQLNIDDSANVFTQVDETLTGENNNFHKRRNDDETHTLCQLHNIQLYYHDKLALQIPHWQLSEGEHCLIKGHNGSGKSTLLRLIYGELKASTLENGFVKHQFKTLQDESYQANVLAHRQNKMTLVSPLIHQSYHAYYTIKEVVLSGFYSSVGVLFHQSYDAKMIQKAEYFMTIFGIDAIANKGVREVSEGQLHRALLSRVMMKDAQLYLFDEFDQFLDQSSRDELFRLLENMVTKQTIGKTSLSFLPTIMMASHFLNEDNCPNWIKRVIYLENGNIIKDVIR